MIEAENVTKVYPTRRGPHLVLDRINLRIAKGERVGVLGRNGSGKSTLIRLIGGAEQPSAGTIRREMTVSWPLAFGGGFNQNLTGFDNLRFTCRVYGVDYASVVPFVEDFTELGVYLREPVMHYSEGMRARLAFALSLAIEFDCYLVDEVIAVGDSRFHEKCNLELFERRKDRAFILVSHSPETIKAHCDRAAVLISGKLHAFGNVDEAYACYEANGSPAGSFRLGSSVPKPAIDLDSPTVEWASDSTPDALGRVLKVDGTYYRAVYKEKVDLARELINKGLLDALAESQLVPRQYPEPISHHKYGLLMRSETAKWQVSTVNFPVDAIRRAASIWIAINRILLPRGYALNSGRRESFQLFGNCVPKWVDVGAITPLTPSAGIDEFLQQLIYPLAILSRVSDFLKDRLGILENGKGIAPEEARQILARAGANQFTQMENTCLWERSTMPRGQFLDVLDEFVADLSFELPRTVWLDYRKNGLERLTEPVRVESLEAVHDRTILELVGSLAPREIIDIGANKGYFACLFAKRGIEVLAIDKDEACVDICYHWLVDKPDLHVCCAVDDFETTPHSADTVVALALTHHLSLTAGLSFDRIADRFAQLARRHVVVEFMPRGLGVTAPQPNPLPAWYTIERFLESLGRRFESVRIVPWDGEVAYPGLRTLVHCSVPRAGTPD